MHAIMYGNVYVAEIALGANDGQTVKAFLEAESYDGPSLIIAYSHCIAHGINMSTAMKNQQAAVKSGHWPLYRYDPRLAEEGKNPLVLDSKAPTIPFREYAYLETRYKTLVRSQPEEAKRLMELAQKDAATRWRTYENLASLKQEEAEPEKAPNSAALK
jgi:pyruvate-ferredoxin/flavodoxin oxidoreductase